VGVLSESFKDMTIARFEIRIPDLHKEPFSADGNINLPLPKNLNWAKLGLNPLNLRNKGEIPQPILHL